MATMTAPRLIALGFAGLGLTTTLVGCAAPAAGGASDGSGGETGVNLDADTSAEYADGSYSATGDYLSPAGPSQVEVEITLDNDAVTAVTVTPLSTDATAKGFQGKFADGIADVVVGRDIDQLAVTRVGGSSLTSGGFNDALAKIKADALSS